jgi:hypothetical protein
MIPFYSVLFYSIRFSKWLHNPFFEIDNTDGHLHCMVVGWLSSVDPRHSWHYRHVSHMQDRDPLSHTCIIARAKNKNRNKINSTHTLDRSDEMR